MPTSETNPIPVALGRAALFFPFVLVAAVLIARGQASPAELAMTVPFLVIPLAIVILRWRSHAH